jgi:hypothetical protein
MTFDCCECTRDAWKCCMKVDLVMQHDEDSKRRTPEGAPATSDAMALQHDATR